MKDTIDTNSEQYKKGLSEFRDEFQDYSFDAERQYYLIVRKCYLSGITFDYAHKIAFMITGSRIDIDTVIEICKINEVNKFAIHDAKRIAESLSNAFNPVRKVVYKGGFIDELSRCGLAASKAGEELALRVKLFGQHGFKNGTNTK